MEEALSTHFRKNVKNELGETVTGTIAAQHIAA
jgi:hypothetical protein